MSSHTSRPSTFRSYASTSSQYGYTGTSSQTPHLRPGTGRPGTSRPSTSRPSTSRPSTTRPSTTRPSTTRPSTTRPSTTRPGTTRSGTRRSSRTGSVFGGEAQQIICAVSESRGVTPTVGLAFVNVSTGEAVLSQICDNSFYARTLNKLQVFDPTEILIISTATPPNPKSKMYSLIEENILGAKIIGVDRLYWSESLGLEFVQQLAFPQDLEALRVAIGGNYFATCSFAAALKYLELKMFTTFAFYSLRIKYQPSEGTMMIDLSTIQSLEIIQNVQNPKSNHCLFGLLKETLTPMGLRTLRSNLLQPSTQEEVLKARYDAVEELSSHDDMFYQTRQSLKSFFDIERLLALLIVVNVQPGISHKEQSINNILMLKHFVDLVPQLYEVLAGAQSQLLVTIREQISPQNTDFTIKLIAEVMNDDATYQKAPLQLRQQRTYAIKSGVNGFLDVARQTFKEATEDVHRHVAELSKEFKMQAEMRYEGPRRYYLRIPEGNFEGRTVPDILVNCVRKKGFIECHTLALMKLNQRLADSHEEVIMTSDKTVQTLLESIRCEIGKLYRVCESIAMLDMIGAFAHLAISNEYVKPEIGNGLIIEAGRHPVKEIINRKKYVPNDVYATPQSRFQIITGCNMSGKSTYIRSIALICILAQTGSFVPARFARFPIIRQIFARVSVDDSIEGNVSTFASEMRETAFILRNIDKDSLVIIDELGRGTSTRDGLAIALSIAEALVESQALIWFVTHFHELAQILQHRPGVVNQHLAVDTNTPNSLTMLYKVKASFVQEEHYGLALARVVKLPPRVLEIAEMVTKTLDDKVEANKKSSKGVAIAKRRKLVLSLRETLQQALDSPMDGPVLLSWLRKLQEEFIMRMDSIDNNFTSSEAAEEEYESEPGEGTIVTNQESIEDGTQAGTELDSRNDGDVRDIKGDEKGKEIYISSESESFDSEE